MLLNSVASDGRGVRWRSCCSRTINRSIFPALETLWLSLPVEPFTSGGTATGSPYPDHLNTKIVTKEHFTIFTFQSYKKDNFKEENDAILALHPFWDILHGSFYSSKTLHKGTTLVTLHNYNTFISANI